MPTVAKAGMAFNVIEANGLFAFALLSTSVHVDLEFLLNTLSADSVKLLWRRTQSVATSKSMDFFQTFKPYNKSQWGPKKTSLDPIVFLYKV